MRGTNTTREGLFAVARERIADFKAALRARRCERALERDPEDASALAELGVYYELGGERVRAAECYTRLAAIHRTRRATEDLALYCRRLERMGRTAEAVRFYADLARLSSEQGLYAEAASACERVVELYCAEGQASVAAGYLRNLPPLGYEEAAARAALERVVVAARGAMNAPPSVDARWRARIVRAMKGRSFSDGIDERRLAA